MPISGDQPAPSINETGAIALTPLLSIKSYQTEDPKLIVGEHERAGQDKAKLWGYFILENQAFESVLPQLGISEDVTKTLNAGISQQIKSEKPLDLTTYSQNRDQYFATLRSSGKYSADKIKLIEDYERSLRRMTVIGLLKPAEYIVRFNDNKIPMPQVTEEVRAAYAKRDDTAGAEGWEAQMSKLDQNKQAVVEAIKNQILATHK
jgi:hypothetical protein